MSYNLDNFRVVKVDNFRINPQRLDSMADAGALDMYKYDNGRWTIQFAFPEVGEMEGRRVNENGVFVVESIQLYGGGSGLFMSETLEPLLAEDSAGYLEAILVWEGGDSLQRMTVRDGQIDYRNLYGVEDEPSHVVKATLPAMEDPAMATNLSFLLVKTFAGYLDENRIANIDVMVAIGAFVKQVVESIVQQTPDEEERVRATALAILYNFVFPGENHE